ncbi:B3GALT1.2 family protein [Megaselia abdita]
MKKIKAKIIALICTFLLIFVYCVLTKVRYHSVEDFHVTYPLRLDVRKSVSQLEADQEPELKPINNFNFTYKLNPTCHTKQSTMTLIVKSSTVNFFKRQAIRETWGNETIVYKGNTQLRTLFMLGNSGDAELEAKLKIESNHYNDIIQCDFLDTYYNNTIKTMMAMKYALQNCHYNSYFVFVDDDFFISIANLLRFLESPLSYPKNTTSSDLSYLQNSGFLYAGHAYFGPVPYRAKENKWYVSEEEYPYYNYPDFVAGGTLILNRSALRRIYFTSLYVQSFRLDDVYIGMAAAKANITPIHSEEFYMRKKEFEGYDSYKDVISSHGFKDSDDMVNTWRSLR